MTTETTVATIREAVPGAKARVGLILGSGLSALADAVEGEAIDYSDLPGFPQVGVSGYAPKLVLGQLEGVDVAVLGGREHYYEHGRADAMRLPLEVLAALGVEILIATNACG
ncbi:MAG: purine-nucleoside phosphorylase, partial [Pseudomonadota bacterium]